MRGRRRVATPTAPPPRVSATREVVHSDPSPLAPPGPGRENSLGTVAAFRDILARPGPAE